MNDDIDKNSDEYIEMLNQLKDLVERSPAQAVNILNAASRTCKSGQHEKAKQQNRRLCHWLYDVTKHLDQFNCGTAQRIHWVINGLEEFPRCIVCGREISDMHKFKSIRKGYIPFCSNYCAKQHGSHVSTKNRREKNNGKYFSDETIAKTKQSFIDHYGVDNNMKCEQGKKELRDAIEKKYGEGIINVFQVEETKQKSKQSKKYRYGDENYSNHAKAIRTRKNWSTERKQQHAEHMRNVCLSHFGVDHPSKDPVIHRKIMKNRRNGCYVIDRHSFDSMPEFCFYVCCRDFGVEVVCHPADKAIEYFDASGKKHHYYPDFYLPKTNKLVEIKGDQFFKDHDPSKSLVPCYGNDEVGKFEAKYNAMVANDVMVLSSHRYMHYVNHVKLKYGSKWIREHKIPCRKKLKEDSHISKVNKTESTNKI